MIAPSFIMAPLMTKSETPAPITIFLTEPLSYPSHMTFSFNSKNVSVLKVPWQSLRIFTNVYKICAYSIISNILTYVRNLPGPLNLWLNGEYMRSSNYFYRWTFGYETGILYAYICCVILKYINYKLKLHSSVLPIFHYVAKFNSCTDGV